MYKLFDKRNSFSFLVVPVPYQDSNILFKTFCSQFRATKLTSARTVNDDNTLSINSKILINQMMKQRVKKNTLKIKSR